LTKRELECQAISEDGIADVNKFIERPINDRFYKIYAHDFSRHFPDNLQIRSDDTLIAPPAECIFSAGIRRLDLGDLAVSRSPFDQFCHHPDAPLSSFSPRR
jgi:hypothetical protein